MKRTITTILRVILVILGISSVKGLAAVSSDPPPVFLPTSQDGLIKQAATAISTALLDDHIHLQSIRLPLSEAMYSDSEEAFVADRAIGWQGGPQETLRYLSPLVRQLLQRVETLPDTSMSQTGLVPRIIEQGLLDFDGSALLTAECSVGSLGDAQALLQPNTDGYYRYIIQTIEGQLPAKVSSSNGGERDDIDEASEMAEHVQHRLFLLVNPAWRDASSFGLFAAEQAQTEILDRYETTYAVDQFVVRGQKLSLLKAWPFDWCLFWSKLSHGSAKKNAIPKFLGSFPIRPSYQIMDELLHAAIKDAAAR